MKKIFVFASLLIGGAFAHNLIAQTAENKDQKTEVAKPAPTNPGPQTVETSTPPPAPKKPVAKVKQEGGRQKPVSAPTPPPNDGSLPVAPPAQKDEK
jgi:hypothetical protein